jgi:hypothetical protein
LGQTEQIDAPGQKATSIYIARAPVSNASFAAGNTGRLPIFAVASERIRRFNVEDVPVTIFQFQADGLPIVSL